MISKSTAVYYTACGVVGAAVANGGITISDYEFYIIITCVFVSRLTGQYSGKSK